MRGTLAYPLVTLAGAHIVAVRSVGTIGLLLTSYATEV